MGVPIVLTLEDIAVFCSAVAAVVISHPCRKVVVRFVEESNCKAD